MSEKNKNIEVGRVWLPILVVAGFAAVALIGVAFVLQAARITRLEHEVGTLRAAAATAEADSARREVALATLHGSKAQGLELRLDFTLSLPPTVAMMSPAASAAQGAPSLQATGAAGSETAPAAPERRKTGWMARLLSSIGLAPGADSDEIAAGIRDALHASLDVAVGRLEQSDGFLTDPDVAITLPSKLLAVRSVLRNVGLASLMDDLQMRMSKAARKSLPIAAENMHRAVAELPIDDPAILRSGASDAATRYFQSRMSARLAREMRPVLQAELEEAGAIEIYDQAIGVYSSLPFVPQVEGDITGFIAARQFQGIAHYMGAHEAVIRTNPAQRTTDAMRAAFDSP